MKRNLSNMKEQSQPQFVPDKELKLMDQVRQVLRYHHYSYRTEQAYCNWILHFVKYHGSKTHPNDMGKPELETYLSHLAVYGKVSAATQRQALNALVFLFHRVLNKPLADQIEPVKARQRKALPVVLTKEEVRLVLSHLGGKHKLMAGLLYGGGLRLMECIRLRV